MFFSTRHWKLWGGQRQGAGRKPLFDEPARQVAFTLPDRLADHLLKTAALDGKDVSVYLAKLLEDAK